MKIIHFSDIHFSNTYSNSILNKKNALLKYLSSVDIIDEEILVLVAGDVANFGISDEYQLAHDFFSSIISHLKKSFPQATVDILFIPGNHDCDFSNSENNEIRKILMKSIIDDPNTSKNSNALNLIINQEPFKTFIEPFHNNWNKLELIYENSLVSVLAYNKINFLNLNTAWFSSLKESAGQMYFNEQFLYEAIPYLKYPTITIMHHPSHWLEPNNKRIIDDIIFNCSNVIISGHEHSNSEFIKNTLNSSSLFIEGSCLQELNNSNISTFNLIDLNTSEYSLSIKSINYKDNLYQNLNRDQNITFNFGELKPITNNTNLNINNDFDEFLNDLGIPLTHPRKLNVQLNDLFVFPEIEEVIYEENNQELLNITKIMDVIENDNESILIFAGETDSGKTTLLKTIFKYKLGLNIYPLKISSENISSSQINEIEKLIQKNFDKVYTSDKLELYLQLKLEQRILMIDDWHLCKLNDKAKKKFFENCSKYFSQLIIFSDITTPISPSFLLSFQNDQLSIRRFKILELGHQKREELIEKWILLGQEDTLNQSDLFKEIDKFKRDLEFSLKNKYIPKYPLYIILILNSLGAKDPHKLELSSNGFYFELLIKESLVNIESKYKNTNRLYQYLTNLAHELLNNASNNINGEEWIKFHKKHLDTFDLDEEQFPFVGIKDNLLKAKIISNKNFSYEFSYPHVFYYFVAQYFARNLKNRDVQHELLEITNNIHITKNANILMFLIHLSSDEYILECVLTSSEYLLADISPSRLEDDFIFINKLCKEVIYPEIEEDVDVYENRKNLNISLDKIEKEQSQIDDSSFDEEVDKNLIEEYNIINKAHKMLEVIGQISRNYHGSLTAEQKLSLSEEHFKLGLRLNHWLIQQIEVVVEPLLQLITDYLHEKVITDVEESKDIAKHFVYIIASIITHNNIWKIATTTGTEELKITFNKVQNKDDSVAIKLINLIIKIEYFAKFPYKELEEFVNYNKNNYIVMRIIQEVVQRHLRLNELPLNDFKEICKIAKISISKKQLVNKIREGTKL